MANKMSHEHSEPAQAPKRVAEFALVVTKDTFQLRRDATVVASSVTLEGLLMQAMRGGFELHIPVRYAASKET